ncbi:MAG: glycoside hydrolase family 13 protein, partial [Bacteroidota bacterium]
MRIPSTIFFFTFFLLFACLPASNSYGRIDGALSAQQPDPYAVPEHVPDEILTAVPDWAQEAVWYQIFVERFRDGDPGNQPTMETIEGSWPHNKPESWEPTPWGHDWYRMETWAIESGKEFYRTVHMRRYGGDLQGVLDKLDYLAELGVTAIYFNPLNDAPSLHKYDARNYRHIDVNFGPDPEGDLAIMAREDPANPDTWIWTSADKLFLQIIEEAHKRDIRVIMDYSWNHTGITFWAWQHILEHQEASPYGDWYQIDRFNEPATEENEFSYPGWAGVPELPQFRRYDSVEEFEHGDLIPGDFHPDLKRHIFAVTRRWLAPDGDVSRGVDGFRLDVAELIPVDFWRDYRKFVRSVNPEAFLVGELWWADWPQTLMDPTEWLQGDIFDAVMNYRWYRPTRQWLGGAEPELRAPTEYVHHLDSITCGLRPEVLRAQMNLTASHDTPRFSTSIYNQGLNKYRVNPRENSDYKLHRPDERTWRDVRLILAQQFTWIGAPHIWMGDELGMWGADDPDCRKPLIWPDLEFEDETAHPFGADRPRDEVRADEELLAYYRHLIQLRRDHPVFVR